MKPEASRKVPQGSQPPSCGEAESHLLQTFAEAFAMQRENRLAIIFWISKFYMGTVLTYDHKTVSLQ